MKNANEQVESLVKRCIDLKILTDAEGVKSISDIPDTTKTILSKMINGDSKVVIELHYLVANRAYWSLARPQIEGVYGLYLFEKNLIRELANYSTGDLSISISMDEYTMLDMPATVATPFLMIILGRFGNKLNNYTRAGGNFGFRYGGQIHKAIITEVGVRVLLDAYRDQIQDYRATAPTAPVTTAATARPIVPAFSAASAAAAAAAGPATDTVNRTTSSVRPS